MVGIVPAVGPGVDKSWISKTVATITAISMTRYGLVEEEAVVAFGREAFLFHLKWSKESQQGCCECPAEILPPCHCQNDGSNCDPALDRCVASGHFELQLVIQRIGVDHYMISMQDFPVEDLDRQGILNQPLDRAL